MATPEYVARWFPDGVGADALENAPFVDFDRRDSLQRDWLRAQGVGAPGVPRHYVPASHDFARAVELGLGWGMLPQLQVTPGRLVRLGGPPMRVTLHWQQWNLHSALLDEIAVEVADEARERLAH